MLSGAADPPVPAPRRRITEPHLVPAPRRCVVEQPAEQPAAEQRRRQQQQQQSPPRSSAEQHLLPTEQHQPPAEQRGRSDPGSGSASGKKRRSRRRRPKLPSPALPASEEESASGLPPLREERPPDLGLQGQPDLRLSCGCSPGSHPLPDSPHRCSHLLRSPEHPKSENIHCCGVKAYNIKDLQMKCCAGTLYNLTALDKNGGDTQCCGSSLQKPQDVCCSSEDKEVLYSAKRGFRCCGHVYYNTTLWSCCAERLTSISEPRPDQKRMVNGPRLLSVNNLNRTDLCEKIHVGTVESVSLHSIVFRNVLKVHGKNATVKALPLSHILETDDHCSSPKLIPGKTYFFNEVNVFIDFNHDFVLQSLHFIISKCSP